MTANRTITLRGLGKNDEMVFSSLLSLLSVKTQDDWVVSNKGDADATVVDLDDQEGRNLATNLEQQGTKVIFFGNNPDCRRHPLWLGKPLRAADILRCIKELESKGAAPIGTATPVKKSLTGVHLKRWPDKTILQYYPGANRLCAVLMRHTMSLEKASKMSGFTYERVAEFVELCKSKGYIEEKNIDFMGNRSAGSQNADERRANTSLFDRLRVKFAVKA